MFERGSRYHKLETAVHRTGEGEETRYVRRRFPPHGATLLTMVEVIFTEGDRLDLIAARTLGDSEQFWRICDKEDILEPEDLTRETGRVIRVPLPQVSS